jgi:hypothetical protein
MKTLKIGFATKRLDVQQAAHGCQVASSWCPRWASETAGGLETVPKFQRTDLLPQDLPSRSEKLVANQMAKASFAGRTSHAKNDLVISCPKLSGDFQEQRFGEALELYSAHFLCHAPCSNDLSAPHCSVKKRHPPDSSNHGLLSSNQRSKQLS